MAAATKDFFRRASQPPEGSADIERLAKDSQRLAGGHPKQQRDVAQLTGALSAQSTEGATVALPTMACDAGLKLIEVSPEAQASTGLVPGDHMAAWLGPRELRALESIQQAGKISHPMALAARSALVVALSPDRIDLVLLPGAPRLSSNVLDAFEEEVAIFDAGGRLVHGNATWRRAHPGFNPGQPLHQILPLHEALREMTAHAEVLAGLPSAPTSTRQVRDHDGIAHMRNTTRHLVQDEHGDGFAVLVRSRDITEQNRLEEDSRFANMVLDQSLDAIVVTSPTLRLLNVNPAFLKLTGFLPASLLSKSLTSLRPTGEGQVAEGWRAMSKGLAEEGHWRGELTLRRADGSQVVVWCGASQLQDENGKVLGHLFVQSDLSEILQIQAENDRLAHYDTLTRLHNRKAFAERIDECLLQARRAGQRCAIIYLDLNDFKSVNDSLGHAAGDQLLVAIAERLVATAGAANMVARIGGDEFLVLLPVADVAAAEALAARLLSEICRPVDLDGMAGYRPLASLGIAAYPEHGLTADELMRSADTAMYAAKTKRAPVAAFHSDMRREATQLLEMRNALTGAVGRGEFQLFYQPIIRLSNGEIAGAEALLRWIRPGRGPLPPRDFLQLAEMAGLLHDIDRWVLQRAAAEVASWRESGLFASHWWISVNQTADDLLQPEWGSSITEAARLAGPGGLQIELTEGHVCGSLEALQRGLRALEELGVKLAVDDFGTGNSNLSYLYSLPITTVKIDRSFVQDLKKKRQAHTLVRAMIGLSREFGYSVVAEGIETADQLAFLRSEGCDMGQGYLFSRPLDSVSFRRFLLKHALGSVPIDLLEGGRPV